MGNIIVSLEGEFGQEEARGWEGRVLRRVCREGQQEALAYLEELDEVCSHLRRPIATAKQRLLLDSGANRPFNTLLWFGDGGGRHGLHR